MGADVVFIPVSVVSPVVVAAVGPLAVVGERLLGAEDRVRGAVEEVGEPSLAADPVDDRPLPLGGVTLVDRGALVGDRGKAVGGRGDEAAAGVAALVGLPLEGAGAPRVVEPV